MPRSRLGTVPRLVAAPCVTSDKAHYVVIIVKCPLGKVLRGIFFSAGVVISI